MDKAKFDILAKKLYKFLNSYMNVEQKKIFSVEGVKLTTYQLHLIDLIGRFPDLNVTEIANILDVTKSAVSQKLTWLEKNGFIIKTGVRKDSRETCVHLTPLGKNAYQNHLEHHSDLDKDLLTVIENVSEDNYHFLLNLLEMLTETVSNTKKYEKKH